jgi:hypothetical protein
VANCSPEVRRLALDARELIRDCLPGVEERIKESQGIVGYGYEPGYKGLVCTLILSKGTVKLGIAGGATMPDPEKLLEGSGKQHRHINVRTAAALNRKGVKELLAAARARARRREKLRS